MSTESESTHKLNVEPASTEALRASFTTETAEEYEEALAQQEASKRTRAENMGTFLKVGGGVLAAGLVMGGGALAYGEVTKGQSRPSAESSAPASPTDLGTQPTQQAGNLDLHSSSPSASAIPSGEASGNSIVITLPESAKSFISNQELGALEEAAANRISPEDLRGLTDQQIIDKVSIKQGSIKSVDDYGHAFARQLDIATMAGTTPEEFASMGGASSYTPEKGNALAAKYDRPLATAIFGAPAPMDPTTADAHAWNVRMASNMKSVNMAPYDCITATTETELMSGSIESGHFMAKVTSISKDNVSEAGYGKWLAENGLGYDRDNIGKGEFVLEAKLVNGTWETTIISHTGSNVSKSMAQ